MKKLLLLFPAIFVLSAPVKAQMDTVITDTLHYYFNKYYFMTGDSLKNFPYYKSAAATVTQVTHVGSKFENDDTLTIYGLEAFAARNARALPTVKIHLYLCTLNVNGMPVLPAIDSVVTAVTQTEMLPIGGSLYNGPKKLTKDFAILFRNMSTVSGDTAHLIRTGGLTQTNTPSGQTSSEGNGIVRFSGQFYSATNYTAQGFGYGTDYEFCVAPRVSYSVHVNHQTPMDIDPTDTVVCTQEQRTYTNYTTRRVSHRMYNMVEFRRRWDNNPNFHPAAVPVSPLPGEHSAITWHFIPEDDRNIYLPVGANQIIFYTDSAHKSLKDGSDSITCFPGNEYRVRHFGMNYRGGVQKIWYDDVFTLCTTFCNDDNVGLRSNSLSGIKIYPNPAVNGKTNVTGLDNNSDITVYNVLGQAVLRQTLRSGSTEINLNGLAPGQYILKMQNAKGTKVVKILKQD